MKRAVPEETQHENTLWMSCIGGLSQDDVHRRALFAVFWYCRRICNALDLPYALHVQTPRPVGPFFLTCSPYPPPPSQAFRASVTRTRLLPATVVYEAKHEGLE
ncbi:hypothetical protein BaRGS_00034851 [Batillaria attramentaria]|uniref:Uncharacterized protein n=1 Tax=Batillaria attramentaria TaxID=370345 RepID=A0ABD0JGJ0_9CAEN